MGFETFVRPDDKRFHGEYGYYDNDKKGLKQLVSDLAKCQSYHYLKITVDFYKKVNGVEEFDYKREPEFGLLEWNYDKGKTVKVPQAKKYVIDYLNCFLKNKKNTFILLKAAGHDWNVDKNFCELKFKYIQNEVETSMN